MASAATPLPFLGDDIFVLIAAELDARMLGRLGCVAQRFQVPYRNTSTLFNVMALAETLKLRGLNREVGVPRPCFGAVAPGDRKLMVTNSKT